MNVIKGDVNIPIFIVETVLGIGIVGLIFLGIITYYSSVVSDTSPLLRKVMISDDLIHLIENCLKSGESYITAESLNEKLISCKYKYSSVTWTLVSVPAIDPLEISGCLMGGGIECGRTDEGYVNCEYIEVTDLETGQKWHVGRRSERSLSTNDLFNELAKKKEIFVNIKNGDEIHIGKIYLEVKSEND